MTPLLIGVAAVGFCIKQQQLLTQCSHQESLHLRYRSVQCTPRDYPVTAAWQTYKLRSNFDGELFRLYLREMGVEPELLDIVDRNWELGRVTELPPSEWARLRIVTDSP